MIMNTSEIERDLFCKDWTIDEKKAQSSGILFIISSNDTTSLILVKASLFSMSH